MLNKLSYNLMNALNEAEEVKVKKKVFTESTYLNENEKPYLGRKAEVKRDVEDVDLHKGDIVTIDSVEVDVDGWDSDYVNVTRESDGKKFSGLSTYELNLIVDEAEIDGIELNSDEEDKLNDILNTDYDLIWDELDDEEKAKYKEVASTIRKLEKEEALVDVIDEIKEKAKENKLENDILIYAYMNSNKLEEATNLEDDKKTELEERLASLKTQLEVDGEQLADDEKEAIQQEIAELEAQLDGQEIDDKIMNESKEILKEAKVIWSDEVDTSEEAYKADLEANGYSSEEEAINDGFPSYETWIETDRTDESEYLIDDFNNNILPQIENQLNLDYIFLTGKYNSNYEDFRPSGEGGVTLKGIEELKDYLTRWDSVILFEENGELGIKCADHDGSVTLMLNTFSTDNEEELAKILGYDEEDFDQFENDLYYKGIDTSDVAEHPEIVKAITNTITESEECLKESSAGTEEKGLLTEATFEIDYAPDGEDLSDENAVIDSVNKWLDHIADAVEVTVVELNGPSGWPVVRLSGNKEEIADFLYSNYNSGEDSLEDIIKLHLINESEESTEFKVGDVVKVPYKYGSYTPGEFTEAPIINIEDGKYITVEIPSKLEVTIDQLKKWNTLGECDKPLKEDSYDSGIFYEIEQAFEEAGLNPVRFIDDGILTRNIGWTVSSNGQSQQISCDGSWYDEEYNESAKYIKEAYSERYGGDPKDFIGDLISVKAKLEELNLDGFATHLGKQVVMNFLDTIDNQINMTKSKLETEPSMKEAEEPTPRKMTKEEFHKEFGDGCNVEVINAGREPEERIEIIDEAERYQVREFEGPGAKFGVFDTKEKKFIQKGSKYVMDAACKDLNSNKEIPIAEAEVKGLKEIKNQGNIYMLEDETNKFIVGENYNAEEGLIENAEIYDNKEAADKDYLDRCEITGGSEEAEVVEEGVISDLRAKHHANKAAKLNQEKDFENSTKEFAKSMEINDKESVKLDNKAKKLEDKAQKMRNKATVKRHKTMRDFTDKSKELKSK